VLKNRYQEIIVGLSLMSLVRGLISVKRNRSTLLIHDHRFQSENYPMSFISEMEVLSLIRLGKTYDVPELQELRQFLTPSRIELVTTEARVTLGRSPIDNLKELLRKYPELIGSDDLDLVFTEGEREFDRFFMEELRRYERLAHESSQRPKGFHFEIQEPKWFKNIYSRFAELINCEYAASQSLKFSSFLHLLGVSAEEKLKTKLAPEEIPYYFFRALSPIYRLQDFFLITQLKRRLTLLGGDFKESEIQFWQLHQGKFENLLLASFEGVISGERVLFFSHLPVDVPFQLTTPFGFYRKIQMIPQKRSVSPFPVNSLTLITDSPLLGSERPYRALSLDATFAFYHLPYFDMPASKAEFYERTLQASFTEDRQRIPFEASELISREALSATLDLRGSREERKQPGQILMRLPLDIVTHEKSVQGFEYWGIFRYRSLGILALSYGVEGI
jgi:hypothetical protein